MYICFHVRILNVNSTNIGIMEQKKNIAIYCRVSTQMQTTDRQEEELTKLARERSDWNLREDNIFVDVISGFKSGESRPQYNLLLQRIEEEKIDIILFSELSRLGRNATDLLEQIELLRQRKIALFFQKQNIWVLDNKDLGSTILLHVLAVMSSYEIELFTERSLSGKISKLQAGGGCACDDRAYGYCNDSSKKIVIDEEEAEVVRRIFTLYSNGSSTIDICTLLNSEGVPAPYTKRIEKYREKRAKKGLEPKEYKHIDVDNLKWRTSSLLRILRNKLYIGNREITFYKPDPTNTKRGINRENREVAFYYNKKVEELRIVSDELFQEVQDKLAEATYNRNNQIRHENLLKHLIKCGECGSNFSVGKNSGERSYRCYGSVVAIGKEKTCNVGVEQRMSKLDGLILQLSLQMFASNDLQRRCSERIERTTIEINSQEMLLGAKEKELDKIDKDYKDTFARLIRNKKYDEDIVEQLIEEEKEKYDENASKLRNDIQKLKDGITSNKILIKSLRKMEGFVNIKSRMEEIRNDKTLIKPLMDEYIKEIVVYRPTKLWALIVVKYRDGGEVWGTLKNARYKKDEEFHSELTDVTEYKTWVVVNLDNKFTYNKDNKTITYNGESEYMQGVAPGTYSFDEFQKELERTNNIGSFPLYYYEESYVVEKENVVLTNTDDSKVDWKQHNEEVLRRLASKNKESEG